MRLSLQHWLLQQQMGKQAGGHDRESLLIEAADMPEGRGGAGWTNTSDGRRPPGGTHRP